MTSRTLSVAFLALLTAAPALAAERFVGQVPRGYSRAGTPYYGSSYYGRGRSESSSSSAYFPGFYTHRRVTEAEVELGYGPVPRREAPAAPGGGACASGWEVVNARPGEASCVGLPKR